MTVVWALLLGLAIGVVMGSLGGGGAILAVPAMVYLLGQTPHAATTSSLVVVGVGAVAGAIGHARRGNVLWWRAIAFGLLGAVGNALGSVVSASISGTVLMVLFSLLLVVVAVLMVRRLRSGRTGGDGALSVREYFANPRRAAALVGVATAVGFLTGFFGVGGGFMIVPALTLVLAFPFAEAVGSSLVVIALGCTISLMPRLVMGADVNWLVTGSLTVGAVAGSLLGAKVAARVPVSALQIGFVVLLVAVAVYSLVSTLWLGGA